MLPTYLPPEKNAETKDSSELRNFLEQDFAPKYIPASLRDVEILTDAHIRLNGEVFPSTQRFLENMAAAIGMPVRYVYDIDLELFRYNFDQRKMTKDHAMQVCVIAGRAVGLVPSDYRPARTLDMLEAWAPLNNNLWKFQKASLSDRSVEIDLLSEDFTVEPKLGDVIRAGIRLVNSETGEFGLKASLFTYRLACSNGSVMSDHLGTVRWNYDKRVTYRASIAKCAGSLAKLGQSHEKLRDIYTAAMDTVMLEEDFAPLWRRVRSAGNFTPERADLIFGITSEERRSLVTAVNERHAAGNSPQPTPWNIFMVHNQVTAAAKGLPMQMRSRLEGIGGDILSSYLAN